MRDRTEAVLLAALRATALAERAERSADRANIAMESWLQARRGAEGGGFNGWLMERVEVARYLAWQVVCR